MPKTLKSGEREMVLKVKSFCEKEKSNKGPIIPFEYVRLRVAAMTGKQNRIASFEQKTLKIPHTNIID